MIPSPANPGGRKDRLAIVQQKADDFVQHYRHNKIFVPRATAKKIDHAFFQIRALIWRFDRSERMHRARGTISEPRAALLQNNEQKLDELHHTLPLLLESLEDDFQKILGFPPESKDTTHIQT
jgi:hypothetical protein